MSDFEEKYRRWHQMASYIKSGIRIFTCIVAVGALMASHQISIIILASGLLVAEFVGIAEEWI